MSQSLSLDLTVNRMEQAALLDDPALGWRVANAHSTSLAGSASLPRVGEVLAGYWLEAILGRGAQGVVFLASEQALGDRPVVLKVGRRAGAEHLALAKLNHPNIVPIYAVHEDLGRNLRILAMPYHGGATLEHLLDSVRNQHPADRTLERFLSPIDQGLRSRGNLSEWSGPRQFLSGASYHGAIAWIGACLAEALQAANRRGIVHLDLKPSNLLIADDGQPMLLDFHVAREPVPVGVVPVSTLGGTQGYMAPEHALAMTSIREGRATEQSVDTRADIYSLGVVLFEALGGAPPPGPDVSAAYLLRANPKLGSALAAAVTRCLAADPDQRYPNGAALAADLRYYLGLPTLREQSQTSWLGRLFGRFGCF